jgi:hypothetical protein
VDQLAHVLDVIASEIGAVTFDALFITGARAAVSADQDQRDEAIGVIEPQEKRDPRADAATAADRALDAQVLHHAENVVAHIFQRVGGCDLGGAPIAADIDAHDLEPGREMGSLVHPKVMVEGIGVNENHRRPVTRDLVPDVDTIGAAEGHRLLRWTFFPAFNGGPGLRLYPAQGSLCAPSEIAVTVSAP